MSRRTLASAVWSSVRSTRMDFWSDGARLSQWRIVLVTGRRKLLLADDSITIQKVVSLTFADEGMDVATASDGDEAVRLLQENVPDIVLADVFMPRRSGYEVCEHIKGDQRFRHIPVMLLVGTFEPFNEAEARRVGADDVLTKPFQSIRNLVNKVGALLGGGQQADQNADTLDLSPPPPPPQSTAAHDAAASDAAAHHAHVAHDPAASFADIDLDDELIEATPAERFGHARAESVAESRLSANDDNAPSSDDDEQHIPLVVMRPEEEATEETPVAANMADTLSLFDDEQMPAQRQEMYPSMTSQEEPSPAIEQPEHAFAARPAFAAHASVQSDDSLLDLGVVESTSSSAVADDDDDDFVLDLSDDVSPAASASSANASATTNAFVPSGVFASEEFAPVAANEFATDAHDAERALPVDYAGAFAEAAHGETVEATRDAGDSDNETPTLIAQAPSQANFGEPWGEPARADDTSATHDFEISMPPPEVEAADASFEIEATEAAPETAETSGVFYAEAADFAPASGAAPASESAHALEDWSLDIGGATESASDTAAADSATDSDTRAAAATAFPVEAGGDHAAAATLQSPTLSNTAAQPLTVEQLSPEIIDAIARRAVEQLSEKVVREIAWEVVPQLAELLIKRRLDEENRRTQ